MIPSVSIVRTILRILSAQYTESGMTHLGNPEDTLIATMLSAQTTDVQVLKAFPAFRKRFPHWESLASADVQDIAEKLRTINLYKGKARALHKMAHQILTDFEGKVPSTMNELISLAGVGRKTASVVLSACFDLPSIAVDTHVLRIATKRLQWSKSKTPEHIERDLKKLVPHTLWSEVNRVFVPFGRDICKAIKPQCWRCPIEKYCPYSIKTPAPKE